MQPVQTPRNGAWLFLGDGGEDFGGVAFGFDVVPGVLDLAVCADQERAAHDAQEGFPEEPFHATRTVGFNHLEVGIAEEREIDFLLFFEGRLGLDGIAAGSQDDHAQLIELLLCVTKLGRFGRSTRCVGLREEIKEYALAAEVRQRNLIAIVRFQAKVRRFVTNF
jgi:hypothetical protein